MIYNRLSDYYDQFVDYDLLEMYVNLIKKEKEEGTVMSLGCGTGPLAIQLARNNYYVTGSDISQGMLEKAYNNAVNSDVHIQFYIHNILDPLVQTYDVITMASDVINYVQTEEDVKKVFKNVSNALNEDGIYVFDFLKVAFLNKIHNHHEDILLKDDVLEWTVTKTNVEGQVRHFVRMGSDTEVHYERTFPLKFYKDALDEAGLYIDKKKKTEERVILLCKKK